MAAALAHVLSLLGQYLLELPGKWLLGDGPSPAAMARGRAASAASPVAEDALPRAARVLLDKTPSVFQLRGISFFHHHHSQQWASCLNSAPMEGPPARALSPCLGCHISPSTPSGADSRGEKPALGSLGCLCTQAAEQHVGNGDSGAGFARRSRQDQGNNSIRHLTRRGEMRQVVAAPGTRWERQNWRNRKKAWILGICIFSGSKHRRDDKRCSSTRLQKSLEEPV